MVDSLLGQHHLTKGAKVYMVVPLLKEFVVSAGEETPGESEAEASKPSKKP
jgi:hypothetical protein